MSNSQWYRDQAAVAALEREIETIVHRFMPPPPWLSDVAEALGIVRPSDGDPPAAENPTDLQPGERIEVLEYWIDGKPCSEFEGLATVTDCSQAVRFKGDNGRCGVLIARGPDGDHWRRVPPPQTSAGSEQPVHDSSKPCPRCNRYLWHDARRECAGCGVTAMQLVTERSKPADPNRWPNADPAWIPTLEAKLADQLKSGGYDCVEQRGLMVRAMRLAKDQAVRAKAFVDRDTGRIRLEGLDAGLVTVRLPKPLIAYKRGR